MNECVDILNIVECGQIVKRSPGAIRNLVMRRAIPYRKRSGRLYFVRKEILAWIMEAPGLNLEEIEKSIAP